MEPIKTILSFVETKMAKSLTQFETKTAKKILFKTARSYIVYKEVNVPPFRGNTSHQSCYHWQESWMKSLFSFENASFQM